MKKTSLLLPVRGWRSPAWSLSVLTVGVVWAFAPDLSLPFAIKQPLLLLGLMLLFLLLLARGNWVFPILHAWHLQWRPQNWGWVGLGALLWGLSLVVSVLTSWGLSVATPQTFAQFAQFALLGVLVWAMASQRADGFDERAAGVIEAGIVLAAAGVAALALLQALLPGGLELGLYAKGKMRVFATVGNANLAAFVLVAASPLALAGAWRNTGWRRGVFLGAAVLLALGLIATQSRQAWLALAVSGSVGAFWWKSARFNRSQVLVAIGGVAVLGVLVLWFAVSRGSAFEALHSANARVLMGLSALLQMAQHPWAGVGLARFEMHHASAQAQLLALPWAQGWVDNASAARDAHNDFLQWGATAGMGALMGFALLCGGALQRGWRCAQAGVSSPERWLALLACVTMMLSSTVLTHPATALIFALVLGLTLRAGAKPVSSHPVVPASKLGAWLATAALCLGLVVASTWAYRELRAQQLEAAADRLMEVHDPWLAEQRYRQALDWSAADGKRLKNHATVLYVLGQSQRALVSLEQASRYSGEPGIALLRAEIHAALGDYAAAIPIYQGLTAAFPQLMTPRFVLGQIYAQQGHKEAARAQFQRVIDIQPQGLNQYMTHEKVQLQKALARCLMDAGVEVADSQCF